jgi:hypothetical protein
MCSLATGKTRICYFQIDNELVSLSILISLSGIDSYSTAMIISSDVQKKTDSVGKMWAILRHEGRMFERHYLLHFCFLSQDILFGTCYRNQ